MNFEDNQSFQSRHAYCFLKLSRILILNSDRCPVASMLVEFIEQDAQRLREPPKFARARRELTRVGCQSRWYDDLAAVLISPFKVNKFRLNYSIRTTAIPDFESAKVKG